MEGIRSRKLARWPSRRQTRPAEETLARLVLALSQLLSGGGALSPTTAARIEGLPDPADAGAPAEAPTPRSQRGDAMLASIKVQTPTQPLPLTIWRRRRGGELLFDASLLGRRSYRRVCAYPPVKSPAKLGDEVPACPAGKPPVPTPDSAEMFLGMRWPRTSELADFEYIGGDQEAHPAGQLAERGRACASRSTAIRRARRAT